MAEVNRVVPLKENDMANIATNSAVAIAGPPPPEIDEITNNGTGTEDLPEQQSVPEPVQQPEPMPVQQPEPVPVQQPVPVPMPMPIPVPRPMPPISVPKEIIVEEEFLLKPNAPRLEEESFKDEVDLIPVVRRSRKRVKTASKKTRKYKRCKKNRRRNTKTHRCNTKCQPGKKKNVTNKRCINKGGKKVGKK